MRLMLGALTYEYAARHWRDSGRVVGSLGRACGSDRRIVGVAPKIAASPRSAGDLAVTIAAHRDPAQPIASSNSRHTQHTKPPTDQVRAFMSPTLTHFSSHMSCPWGSDGGLRPCMDDSDGMGVQRGAGHSPAGFLCLPQALKNLGKPFRVYENTPTFTHLEHCHCSRFRSRRLNFHERTSCSSSHLHSGTRSTRSIF